MGSAGVSRLRRRLGRARAPRPRWPARPLPRCRQRVRRGRAHGASRRRLVLRRAEHLPRDPDAWSEGWLEQTFAAPVTVRSVVVGLPGPRGFGAAPPPDAVLECSDDGGTWHEVARLDVTTVPARTASFAPVTARRFRLRLSGASAAEALPPREEGVRMPPVLRRADAFLVSEFALFPAARVHHAEVKAGFGVVDDYYAVDSDPTGALGVDRRARRHRRDRARARRRARLGGAGRRLAHRAPRRLPHRADERTRSGRLDRARGRQARRATGRGVPPRAPLPLRRRRSSASRFAALLSDSIESGPQNWTDRIDERVRRAPGLRRPALAARAGRVRRGVARGVGRFLFD